MDSLVILLVILSFIAVLIVFSGFLFVKDEVKSGGIHV